MSNKKGKKVVVTAPKKAVSTRSKQGTTKALPPLLMGKANYQLIALGAILVALGLALMSGGKMPSPDVWDDSIIYSFRRTVLAPIVIIVGLVVEIFAIFKK